jgi:hypothetical protein
MLLHNIVVRCNTPIRAIILISFAVKTFAHADYIKKKLKLSLIKKSPEYSKMNAAEKQKKKLPYH